MEHDLRGCGQCGSVQVQQPSNETPNAVATPLQALPALRLTRQKARWARGNSPLPNHLAGEDPRLPIMVRQMYGHEPVVGTYRVCVQPSGIVASVTAVSGIPFDDDIKRTLHAWRFARRAVPECIEQELHFVVAN